MEDNTAEHGEGPPIQLQHPLSRKVRKAGIDRTHTERTHEIPYRAPVVRIDHIPDHQASGRMENGDEGSVLSRSASSAVPAARAPALLSMKALSARIGARIHSPASTSPQLVHAGREGGGERGPYCVQIFARRSALPNSKRWAGCVHVDWRVT
ncbi:hypothetical protein OF83DRAFT_1171988 [Amylostereum chailletii]|nr:hypothetical protein OF83DRAFT_1171988 [Amylostereum chailletii]